MAENPTTRNPKPSGRAWRLLTSVGVGFGVQEVEFGVYSLRFGDSGFRFPGSGFGIRDSDPNIRARFFRVRYSGFGTKHSTLDTNLGSETWFGIRNSKNPEARTPEL